MTIYFAQESPRPEHEPMMYSAARGRRTRHVRVCIGGPYGDGLIKIGFADRVAWRMRTLCTYTKRTMTLLGCIDGQVDGERALHKRFIHLSAFTPFGTEWFHPEAELLDFISALPRPHPDIKSDVEFDGRRTRIYGRLRRRPNV